MTLDSFTIGRFASYTNAGCPDGDLHITESDRPAVSGGWCGTSWAPAHYYSETNSITLLVRLYTLSSLDNTGYNFDFRLGYKMLNRNRAVVRYGEQKLFASKCTPIVESYYFYNTFIFFYCYRVQLHEWWSEGKKNNYDHENLLFFNMRLATVLSGCQAQNSQQIYE